MLQFLRLSNDNAKPNPNQGQKSNDLKGLFVQLRIAAIPNSLYGIGYTVWAIRVSYSPYQMSHIIWAIFYNQQFERV